MLKPKVPTTISRLMSGDHFIPEGENTVYQYVGYDSGFELWTCIDILDHKIVLFDDMKCTWLPGYEFLY